jgi:hypothetical protein
MNISFRFAPRRGFSGDISRCAAGSFADCYTAFSGNYLE